MGAKVATLDPHVLRMDQHVSMVPTVSAVQAALGPAPALLALSCRKLRTVAKNLFPTRVITETLQRTDSHNSLCTAFHKKVFA